MIVVFLLLYIVAAILFALAAFGNTLASRFNLVAAGLFFWVLVDVIRALVHVAG